MYASLQPQVAHVNVKHEIVYKKLSNQNIVKLRVTNDVLTT